jgi:hypothetical protein
LSIWHWLILFIYAAILVTPFWKLLPRVRIPREIALLAVVPPFALIFLWILAFKNWDTDTAIS